MHNSLSSSYEYMQKEVIFLSEILEDVIHQIYCLSCITISIMPLFIRFIVILNLG